MVFRLSIRLAPAIFAAAAFAQYPDNPGKAEAVKACAQPRLREAFARQAAVAVTSTPDEITRHLAREIEMWRDIVARQNLAVQ